MRNPARLAPLLALLLCAAPLSAAAPDGDAGDWAAPQAPPPGPVPAPSTPEGGFSSPHRTRFDEKMRDKVLDQLCRHLRLQYVYKPELWGFGGMRLGVARRLAPEPGGRLALVDEETLGVSLSKGISHEVGEGGPTGAFSVGASIEGRSMVVRRLGTTKTCNELDTLIDLRDIKTVLPLKAERIAKMEVGELWRIPLTMSVGYGASLSDVLAEDVPISVSFGYSRGGAASMTLYRLAEDKMRFRFRIDHVTVRSRSLGISHTLGAADFLYGWSGFALQWIDKALARELAKVMSARFDLGRARVEGQKMLIEYVVDPRDPAEASALEEAMRGDFRRLLKSARRIGTEPITADAAGEAYEELRALKKTKLGQPDHAAVEEYRYKSRSLGANFPILFNYRVSEVIGRSSVKVLTGNEGEFRYHPADHSPSAEYFRIPFIGPIVKENNQRRAEVVTFAPRGQGQGEPLMVYMRNQGSLRLPASSIGDTVEEVNSVMRLGGTRRGMDGSRLVLPKSVVPAPTPVPDSYRDEGNPAKEVSDRKGSVSFTMVFNQKAVREAVSAAAGEVLRALAASTGIADRTMLDWLVANGRLEGGELAYDQHAAQEAFKGENDLPYLARMAKTAAGFVLDYGEARDAATNDGRAEALSRLMAGKGRSELSYEQVLRVLVQFVDPMDLTGDFAANIQNTTKGGKDTRAHLVLKKDRGEVPMLREAGEARARFAEASILLD